MTKRLLLSLGLCLSLVAAKAQQNLTYYLPDIEYDGSIPTPEDFFGHQIGEWHLSHDKLVHYMQALAEASPRVTLREYARSYEERPLVYLTITSTDNHSRLEDIRRAHLALSEPNASAKLAEGQPVVLYQGFSIHGNEASGGNAAPLVAYYLAAGQSKEVQRTLNEAIVLLDPCFNPDGFHRFSTWANMHKNEALTSDPQDREYHETWPGGRTNHYWFDLNRDWLLVQHPESQGRIRLFHDWKPNVLTDHHEMGSNSTFFFMPGIPSRTNPITPPLNQELTGRIGNFHAEALDEIGSLYYTKESYDDFYYGKGSTYPDANGCIGILFEQASARGHVQETENGELTFPFTIRNQVRTALSTQKAGVSMRPDLLEYQRNFYRESMEQARKDRRKGYVFGDPVDSVRLAAFVELLRRHDIEVYALKKAIEAEGQQFEPGRAFVVPTEQTQYRLIRGMFETMTSFPDSVFYDVSSWTLPLAFGLPYAELQSGQFSQQLLGQPVEGLGQKPTFKAPARSDYAYLLEWESYTAPKALYTILSKNLRAKVATEPFVLGGKNYGSGTVLIPVQNQALAADDIYQLVQQVAVEDGASITAVGTGLTPEGIDLGSRRFDPLEKPSILLIVGEGVSAYEAGAAWHLLDQRYGIPISMVESEDLERRDLSRYNTLIMVDGNYGLSRSATEDIRAWLRNGGTLIAVKDAVRWVRANSLAQVSFRSDGPQDNGRRAYAKLSPDRGSDRIGGAIMQAVLDLSHPLCFGYQSEKLPVFQRGTLAFSPAQNAYATPAVYSAEPLISGYARPEHLDQLSGAAVALVSGTGSGKTICLSIDPNFRAFWYGTNRLFANSIFFGSIISSRAVERAEE
ncbi:MAG: zinc carboxypeptidase [Bacteroidetes bacterium]|jgi:hypothetical protein|nr:zinc carboxypeptidase [Bacteroidota bacterium]